MITVDYDLALRLPKRSTLFWIILGFFSAAFLAYGSSLSNSFVRFDDGFLIYENPAVRQFSFASLKVIFTTFDPELYIPFTLFVYQMLYLVFGIHAFGYHLLSLLLHTSSSLLLSWVTFTILRAKYEDRTDIHLIGAVSIVVGAFFLLHPLNTEAVSWAAAMKDQLSTFFYLLSFLAYLQFRATAETKPYMWSVTFFFFGLLSKVMVLTLPIAFLLLEDLRGRSIFGTKELWKKLLPYVGLGAVFLVIALFGKKDIVAKMSLFQTMLIACKSTITYLQKLVYPNEFSVLYPQSGAISLMTMEFKVYAGMVTMLVAGIFVSRPFTKWISYGLGIFLVTVLPTYTNFSKGGDIFFASDRYAYLPSLALFTMFGGFLVWLFSKPKFAFPSIHYALLTVAVGIAASLGWKAHAQSLTWKNTETLFSHVLTVYPEEASTAHNNLGNVYRRQGKLEEAVEEFKKGLEFREHPRIRSNLAATYANLNQFDLAEESYFKAKEFDPASELPDFGLGVLYAKMGNTDKAFEAYTESIRKNPRHTAAYLNRGSLYADLRMYKEAEKDFTSVIEIEPSFSQAHFSLGIIYQKQGMSEEAVQAFESAINADPQSVEAYLSLGVLQAKLARLPEAKRTFEKVLRLEPGNPSATSAIQQINAVLQSQ